MHLRLTEEQKMVQETIRKFVEKELIPLENDVLRNEREGRPSLPQEKVKELQLKAKNADFGELIHLVNMAGIAITDKERHAKTGREGVTCFIVDRDMGWRSEYIHTMGEWGPASLIFENVRVPEENILGELHGGYKLGLEWIGFARWIVGARAVGAAERLLQMAIDYAKERVTFGKPIAERQGHSMDDCRFRRRN